MVLGLLVVMMMIKLITFRSSAWDERQTAVTLPAIPARLQADEKWKWSLQSLQVADLLRKLIEMAARRADSLTRQPETIDAGEGLSQRNSTEE